MAVGFCSSGNGTPGASLPHQKVDGQGSGRCVCQQKQVLLECPGLCLVSLGLCVSCEHLDISFPDQQDVLSSRTMAVGHSSCHCAFGWLTLGAGCNTWQVKIQGPTRRQKPSSAEKAMTQDQAPQPHDLYSRCSPCHPVGAAGILAAS